MIKQEEFNLKIILTAVECLPILPGMTRSYRMALIWYDHVINFIRLKFQQESESRALLIEKTNESRDERISNHVTSESNRSTHECTNEQHKNKQTNNNQTQFNQSRKHNHNPISARQKFENVVLKKLQDSSRSLLGVKVFF